MYKMPYILHIFIRINWLISNSIFKKTPRQKNYWNKSGVFRWRDNFLLTSSIPLLHWFVPIQSGLKQLRGSYTRANSFASGIIFCYTFSVIFFYLFVKSIFFRFKNFVTSSCPPKLASTLNSSLFARRVEERFLADLRNCNYSFMNINS